MTDRPAAPAAPAAPDRHPDTIAVSAGRPHGHGEPLNHPIVLASNFRGEEGVYARTHGVATWQGLEDAVGALQREVRTLANGFLYS